MTAATVEAVVASLTAREVVSSHNNFPYYEAPCPVCSVADLVIESFADGEADVHCRSGHCDPALIRDALELPVSTPITRQELKNFGDTYVFGAVQLRHSLRPLTAPVESPSSSWAPVDLAGVLDGSYAEEKTSILQRDDGVALFYAGKVHALYGESESGKSWIATIAAAEQLNAGRRVLYLDFESDAVTVANRLRLLGVASETILSGLVYIRPAEKPHDDGRSGADFENVVLGERWALAVIDGVTDSLMMYELNGNDSREVAIWDRALPRRIASVTGSAVVTIDHVVKSNNERGRFALGSQHKLAALDGAAYVVEPKEFIAPGRRGVIALRVAKDRPGYVRKNAGERRSDRTQAAAEVVLDSTAPDVTQWAVTQPDAADAEGARGEYRDKMSKVEHDIMEYLNAVGSASKAEVEREVSGNATLIRKAIGNLTVTGVISQEKGAHNRTTLRPLVTPGESYSPVVADEGDLTPGASVSIL